MKQLFFAFAFTYITTLWPIQDWALYAIMAIKEKVSPNAMPNRFNRVYDEKGLPDWNFKQWKPDAIVINLGTNDFSTQPYPDKAVFKEGYEKLINGVDYKNTEL